MPRSIHKQRQSKQGYIVQEHIFTRPKLLVSWKFTWKHKFFRCLEIQVWDTTIRLEGNAFYLATSGYSVSREKAKNSLK